MEPKWTSNFKPLFLSIDLTKNCDDYHIIYASQLYGTFFAVGAKFTMTSDCKQITGIDLSINNYKGLYNIGMLKQTACSWDIIDRVGIIVLYLQAYSCLNDDDLVKDLPMTLTKNIVLSEVDKIFTTRKLKSFTKVDSIEKHLDQGAFDSEFFDRNGRFIAKRDRLDNYLPNKPDNQPGIKAADPQGNCMNTTAKLIKI